MNDTTLIKRYEHAMCNTRGGFEERLLMERDGNLAVYYAPFEHVNPAARVCLVGITPGPTQMDNAVLAAISALARKKTHEEALAEAKATGGFSGRTLRYNLVRQLSSWGVHQWLGLRSSEDLFESTGRHLLHTCSLLRFPVAKAGKPYNGTPDMLRQPMLRRFVMEHFAAEVVKIPDAVFIGLGPVVSRALDRLAAEGALPRERIVSGMLHPSPENTYRIDYALSDRAGPVPHATNLEAWDRGRAAFRAHYVEARQAA